MTSSFRPEDWVYKPAALLQIFGLFVPVSGFTLSLQANGIPRLIVRVDAFHLLGAPPEPATAANMSSLVARWNLVRTAISSKTRRRINFKFAAPSAADKLQNFLLSGWIMTSAGFPRVSAQGGEMHFEIEAVHPMYEFQESPAFLLGSGVQGRIKPSKIAKTNVLAALVSALREYGAKHDDTTLSIHAAGDSEYVSTEKIIDAYKNIADILGKRLEWYNPSGAGVLPDKPNTSLDSHIPYSTVEYVKSLGNAGSWDWLVRSFCAQWLLTIYPRVEGDKLGIGPFNAWQTPAMEIYDTETSFVRLPPADPNPVRGVLGLIDGKNAFPSIGWTTLPEGEKQQRREEISFVDEDLRGRILSFAMPGWLHQLPISATAKSGSTNAPYGTNEITYTSGGTANTSDKDRPSLTASQWDDMLKKMRLLAQELFRENYRLHYQVALAGRLMIKLPNAKTIGKFVLPGYVMRLSATDSENKKEPLVDFYVTKVVHSVDCQNAKASTEIGGSFVRAPGEPNIPVGNNLMYG